MPLCTFRISPSFIVYLGYRFGSAPLSSSPLIHLKDQRGNASSALVTWVTRHHTSNALILFRYLFADSLIVMESPNTEYRSGFESRLEKDQQLSDQYKSMRDLLKVYGLSVAEDNHCPQEGKTLKRALLIGCIHFLNPFMCGREQCKR